MSELNVTPPLDEFLAAYREDDNEWWRFACGHHQNLFDEVVDQRDEARAAVERVRELHVEHLPDPYVAGVGRCSACRSTWPCPTIRALDGAP